MADVHLVVEAIAADNQRAAIRVEHNPRGFQVAGRQQIAPFKRFDTQHPAAAVRAN
jgi:hypothetical protein